MCVSVRGGQESSGRGGRVCIGKRWRAHIDGEVQRDGVGAAGQPLHDALGGREDDLEGGEGHAGRKDYDTHGLQPLLSLLVLFVGYKGVVVVRLSAP